MLATHYGGRSDQNAQRNVTLPVTGQLPKPKADSDPFSPRIQSCAGTSRSLFFSGSYGEAKMADRFSTWNEVTGLTAAA
jgi:hypothetical protein